MEVIGIIFLIWLIGCAFPSSGQSYGPGIAEVVSFIVCAALVFAIGQLILVGGVFLAEWLGNIMLFPLTTMGLIATAMLTAAFIQQRPGAQSKIPTV